MIFYLYYMITVYVVLTVKNLVIFDDLKNDFNGIPYYE